MGWKSMASLYSWMIQLCRPISLLAVVYNVVKTSAADDISHISSPLLIVLSELSPGSLGHSKHQLSENMQRPGVDTNELFVETALLCRGVPYCIH